MTGDGPPTPRRSSHRAGSAARPTARDGVVANDRMRRVASTAGRPRGRLLERQRLELEARQRGYSVRSRGYEPEHPHRTVEQHQAMAPTEPTESRNVRQPASSPTGERIEPNIVHANPRGDVAFTDGQPRQVARGKIVKLPRF